MSANETRAVASWSSRSRLRCEVPPSWASIWSAIHAASCSGLAQRCTWITPGRALSARMAASGRECGFPAMTAPAAATMAEPLR